MKRRLFIAEFPYGGTSHWQSSRWVGKLLAKLHCSPWRDIITEIDIKAYNDTPITMTRNLCLLDAEKTGADYVLMIDSDMDPDLTGEGAKPFFESSMEFMLDSKQSHRGGPSIVCAPYCGPPPVECVYAFQWVKHRNTR